MTKLDKAKFLDERLIDHSINKDTGEMFALVKMSTTSGDDCSEWLPACGVIASIKEEEEYFKNAPRFNFDINPPVI